VEILLSHRWLFSVKELFYGAGLLLPEMAQKQSQSSIFAAQPLTPIAHINVRRSETNVSYMYINVSKST